MKVLAPYENFKAITAHDTNLLKNAANENIETRGILVTVAGTVVVENTNSADGAAITIACAIGIVMPIVCNRIKTGGTATGIIAVW